MMSRHRKLERKVDQEGQLTSLRRDSSKETHLSSARTAQAAPRRGGGGTCGPRVGGAKEQGGRADEDGG